MRNTKSVEQQSMFTNILRYKESEGLSQFGPSQTIPDQALTMREILNRYTRNGLSLDMLVGEFDEANPENDLPVGGIMSMDLEERYEYAQRAKESIQDAKDTWIAKQKEKLERLRKAQERQKKLDALIDSPAPPAGTDGE